MGRRSSQKDCALEPTLTRVEELEVSTILARDEDRVAAAENRAIIKPNVDAHLELHQDAILYLKSVHAEVPDEFDFDLVGDTRYAAIWQMTGQCLGIASLIIDGLALGYTSAMIPLARALHEADRLAEAFAMEEGENLLRRWLRGKKVNPSEVRKVEQQFDESQGEHLRRMGVSEKYINVRADLSRAGYGTLSDLAHHSREGTEHDVSARARQMIVGPSDAWIRRGSFADQMFAQLEECVLAVSWALDCFTPDGWYEEKILPFTVNAMGLRESSPLPAGVPLAKERTE
jgi:hypothetical protein